MRIYRQFRKEMPLLHADLRRVKSQRGGQLSLVEILRSAEEEDESDYTGPTGFRGRGHGQVETRDIEFGFIEGQTAVAKDYNPINELEKAIRVLDSFDLRPTEEEALQLAAELEGDERNRRAAVAILQMVDREYERITRKLSDFWRFFMRSNIERLNAYGTHPENAMPFEAKYTSNKDRTLVTFTYHRAHCRLSFANKFANYAAAWPH